MADGCRAYPPPLSNQYAQQPVAARQWPDRRPLLGREAARDEVVDPPGAVGQPERGVACSEHLAGEIDNALEHAVQRALGGKSGQRVTQRDERLGEARGRSTPPGRVSWIGTG